MEKIPHLKVLKIANFSVCDTQILHKVKFGNFEKSTFAILVIFEAFNFTTFESEKITNIPVFGQSENCKLAKPGLYYFSK